ncbi:MAG TPA: hypothetical protein VK810_02460, partial [Dongiaceae bacterium]|nr:hypothetical protein [Dongiaceae bacterium]
MSKAFAGTRKSGAFFCGAPSAFHPVQSPQKCALSAAVGRNEAKMAMMQTAAVASGCRKNNFSEGKIAIAHGSSSGKSLVFALVINDAAKIEAKKSRGDFEI